MRPFTCFALMSILSVSVYAASSSQGEALFAGTLRFRNGGPPCAACHSVSGLPFPNGGALGPDLSRSASKLGSEGLRVVLQTLYFPTMRPVFDSHPLTPEEQGDLNAFLHQAQSGPAPANVVPLLATIAFAGFLVLWARAWAIWRHRLRGVRKPLVAAGMLGGLKS